MKYYYSMYTLLREIMLTRNMLVLIWAKNQSTLHQTDCPNNVTSFSIDKSFF